jgi:hypothetical protein
MLLGDTKNPRKCIANAIVEIKITHQVFRVIMESIMGTTTLSSTNHFGTLMVTELYTRKILGVWELAL